MELKEWQMEFKILNRKVSPSFTPSFAKYTLCYFANNPAFLCGKMK
jgi:hypothetical protein